MNKAILTSASLFALSAAGSALAQSAPADPLTPTPAPATSDCPPDANNCSLVTQSGTGLKTSVTQTGSGNVSDVDQIDGSVGGNPVGVTVNQSGTNATSYVLQSGTGISGNYPTRATVNQNGDGADSTVRQLGTRNFSAFVNQTGANTAYLEQDGAGQTKLDSTASIRQFGGDGNTAVAFQQSGNSSIGSGGNNGITQNGNLNNAEVYQLASGRGFQARSDQVGDRNDSVIIQGTVANNNTMRARVSQTGDNNISSVVQTGINGLSNPAFNNQMVNIIQSGSDNLSRVEQENKAAGGGLTSSLQVIQNADGNDSFIQQSSGSGLISITQNSTDTSGIVTGTAVDNLISGGTDSVRANFSRVIQTGTGRTEATLIQTGFGNLSDIRQDNAGSPASTATVNQNGEDQASFIEQNGSNDIAYVDQVGGGSGNVSRLQQLAGGVGNTADVVQMGSDGESNLTQSGLGNEANLLQASGTSLNASTITQGGSSNDANIYQTTSGNSSTLTQGGTGNMATVTQGPPPPP
ncbi:MAG: hypothetical protein GC147_07390 [Porphyrobacter sp.]|nr:hypothetical protein [Porphyrobacter sp.]